MTKKIKYKEICSYPHITLISMHKYYLYNGNILYQVILENYQKITLRNLQTQI